MADIVINEISQNYSYVIGDSSYCCVALPITSCWGPAYQGFESAQEGESKEDVLENIVWNRFRANSQGLESFVSTYRGAAANYRLSQDYSYQMAVSLLTAGYDVLVCRLCPGTEASSMLRRSYVGKIPADWFSQVDQATGTLTLPVYEDAEAAAPLSEIPFEINSEHPLTVSSTNPNFQGASITSIENYMTADMPTGVYAVKPTIPAPADVQDYYECQVVYAGGKAIYKSADMQANVNTITFLDTSDESLLHREIPNYASNFIFGAVKSVRYHQSSEFPWVDLEVGNDFAIVEGQPQIKTLPTSSKLPSQNLAYETAELEFTFTASYVKYDASSNVTAGSIVYHIKNTEDPSSARSWASAGIADGDDLTYTGDKVLETLDKTGRLIVTAKYPGTFGNRLQCTFRRMTTVGLNYWNFIVYIVDTSGVRLAAENLNFVFDIENSTDAIPFIEEVESQFVTIKADNLNDNSQFTGSVAGPQEDRLTIVFSSGKDKAADSDDVSTDLLASAKLAAERYSTDLVPVAGDEQSQEFTANSSAIPAILIQKGASFTLTLPAGATSLLKVSSCTYTPVGETAVQLQQGIDYTVDLPNKQIILKQNSSIIPTTSVDGSKLTVEFVCPDGSKVSSNIAYVNTICKAYNASLDDPASTDATTASTWKYLEWLFTRCLDLYELLNDKLAYNPNRIISPGWDDQNFLRLTGDATYPLNITTPSPLHLKLMEMAYYSRCATAYIDLPRSLSKNHVSNDSQNQALRGYAQLLARQDLAGSDGLFTTHSALFGPWGTYMYVGTSKQATASPGFLALLIQRSMILNQSLQYEWIQPSSRKNNVNIGKMDYTVSKKYLDEWQPDPDTQGGVGVNAIANIPDLGLSIWGDSTLYENPPATYQALRNLSTRLLVNAIKNVVYKVGMSITFQYTNQTAFSSFYVGVTPILDTMKNSGAIDDYKVIIGNDFDAVGMVKANSCVGKIYITPNGTIQHITVDLIALPPMTDLSSYS